MHALNWHALLTRCLCYGQHLELRRLANSPHEKLTKNFRLQTLPQGKRKAKSEGDITLTFQAKVVPPRYESAAKGHAHVCKLLRPAVSSSDGGGAGGGSAHSAVGNVTVRFKVWDGMKDEDLDNALWHDWGDTEPEWNGPDHEAARVLHAWSAG